MDSIKHTYYFEASLTTVSVVLRNYAMSIPPGKMQLLYILLACVSSDRILACT